MHGVTAGPTTEDIGSRVSVRRRLDDGTCSDVVGDLESTDDGYLRVRRRDGVIVAVARADVVAARVVGPSPRSARALEGVTARDWPAAKDAWLGGWWLRAADGFTARANSVRPLDRPGCALDDALEHVTAWYGEQQLLPRIRVVTGSSLDRELAYRGWVASYLTCVCTATVATLERQASAGGVVIDLSAAPAAAWLALFRGGGAPPIAAQILTGPEQVVFATAGEAASESLAAGAAGAAAPALGIGRASVEGEWMTVSAVEVADHARRRGIGRAIMAALAAWGAGHGAKRCCLEVLADNDAGRALYASLGFRLHHRYVYRQPPMVN